MSSSNNSFRLGLVSLSVESISILNFEKKLETFVASAKNYEIDLIVFPEFSIAPILSSVSDDALRATKLLEHTIQNLANKYKLYICGGSGLFDISGKIYNQSFICSPKGMVIYQPKINLIESEKAAGYEFGLKLNIIETSFVKFAICMCYDIEFPELVRKAALNGVDLILTPSYTVDEYGAMRVHHCAQARAIENHIFIAKSCLVGQNGHKETPCGFGASALYAPIDHGFSKTGIVSKSKANIEDILIAEVDLLELKKLRSQSSTSPLKDSIKLEERKITLERTKL